MQGRIVKIVHRRERFGGRKINIIIYKRCFGVRVITPKYAELKSQTNVFTLTADLTATPLGNSTPRNDATDTFFKPFVDLHFLFHSQSFLMSALTMPSSYFKRNSQITDLFAYLSKSTKLINNTHSVFSI